jgi:hypothetical protein
MRCRQRKQLFQRRNKVCDLSLILGLLGLILVVIDTELTAQKIVSKVREIWKKIFVSTLRKSRSLTLVFILNLVFVEQFDARYFPPNSRGPGLHADV